MKSLLTMTFSLACLMSTASFAESFDAKDFVNTKCVGCHDSRVYTRSNRRVQNIDALTRQVKMCDSQLGTILFDDQVMDVVNYLNDNYYKF